MIITCSDTRTPDTDTSGQLIQKLLAEKGHTIAAYHLVKDEPAEIKARITE
ncbi:MAG: molybdenum cofactor biosynthesis protein, partial [Candidatus Competibacter sp.]|nr:molybdenum cofactor biosynthesis protein [Candidatus Competibacter sp.]